MLFAATQGQVTKNIDDHRYVAVVIVVVILLTHFIAGPGSVWTCGAGQYANGRGDRETTFTPRVATTVSSLQLVSIACGNMVSMGIDNNGGLYTWGKWGDQDDSTPQKIELDVAASKVFLHHEQPYGAVLGVDGGVYAWGKSDDFLTGLGTLLNTTLLRIITHHYCSHNDTNWFDTSAL